MSNPSDSDALDALAARQAFAAERWQEGLALASRALAGSQSPAERVNLGLVAARCSWHLGDLLQCCRVLLTVHPDASAGSDKAALVDVLTLAVFALAELGCAAEALPLAHEALRLARSHQLHDSLPTALSCAAHVHARVAELDVAEAFHMQALSLARESADLGKLQQAYSNLMLSFVAVARELLARGEVADAEAVAARARRYTSHVRSLLAEPSLDEWRRMNLRHDLGELLSVGGLGEEAEALLRECIHSGKNGLGSYSTVTAEIVLAELLHKTGRTREALDLLAPKLAMPGLAQDGHAWRQMALQTGASCCRALGLGELAADYGAQLQQLADQREQLRRLAQASVQAALSA